MFQLKFPLANFAGTPFITRCCAKVIRRNSRHIQRQSLSHAVILQQTRRDSIREIFKMAQLRLLVFFKTETYTSAYIKLKITAQFDGHSSNGFRLRRSVNFEL
jgi:hypothetical protein